MSPADAVAMVREIQRRRLLYLLVSFAVPFRAPPPCFWLLLTSRRHSRFRSRQTVDRASRRRRGWRIAAFLIWPTDPRRFRGPPRARPAARRPVKENRPCHPELIIATRFELRATSLLGSGAPLKRRARARERTRGVACGVSRSQEALWGPHAQAGRAIAACRPRCVRSRLSVPTDCAMLPRRSGTAIAVELLSRPVV